MIDKSNFLDSLGVNYDIAKLGNSMIVRGDCNDVLSSIAPDSVQAVVTDPPYGLKEYEFDQLEKRNNGSGGVWRIPPAFDGSKRSPLPRFTSLNYRERLNLLSFITEFSRKVLSVLCPGGHLIIASNTFLSQLVFSGVVDAGFEFRGEIIRLVRTLRGGDKPKNSEQEFPHVSSLARGCYEPWGVFRKPIPKGLKVSDCLRKWGTGGLRHRQSGQPFEDVIFSERTPQSERLIANHPSLKPQSFMRNIVHASLPLGTGIIVDPFMGSGSTIAACESLGYCGLGIERKLEYFQMAKSAIAQLAKIQTDDEHKKIEPRTRQQKTTITNAPLFQ